MEFDKLLLKFIWKGNRSRIGKPILKKNNIEDFSYQISKRIINLQKLRKCNTGLEIDK